MDNAAILAVMFSENKKFLPPLATKPPATSARLPSARQNLFAYSLGIIHIQSSIPPWDHTLIISTT